MSNVFASIRKFFSELRRRNVYKVAAVYGAVAFVVVQAARLLVPAMVLPEWLYRTVVAAALLGFPFALVFAWAFELTPEGVQQRPVEEDKGDAPSPQGRSPVEPRAGDRSVAVLPFRSLGREEPSPFGEGMHDALLTQLSKVSGLKVISRTSVQQYRGTKKTTAAIARELGVKWVVEGGVQEFENQIQVNAQLIDPRTDTHRWAESYRRDLTAQDLFELQSDLTKHIARSLEAELTSEEKSRVEQQPTRNLKAYRLYISGRQQLARCSFDVKPAATVQEAAESFRQAIDRDAEFALAWAGLADAAAVHQRMVTWAQLAADSDAARRIGIADGSGSALPKPEEAARRALEIDPDLAEAHASMGFVHLQNMDAPAASQALHQALETQPSYWEAHHWLGELYLKIGQPQRALDHVSLAVELNPQHAQARHWLYDAYLAAGQPEASLEEARRQQQRGLEQKLAVMGEVRALVNLGQLEEARALAEEEVSELGVDTVWGGWFQAYRVQILAAQDETDQAREQLRALQAAEAHPSMVAWAHAGAGEGGQAVAMYQQMGKDAWGRIGTIVALRYPATYGLSALKEAPGYPELIRELNQAWGLTSDGSIPTETDASIAAQTDE
jgi:TolB-like protein